MEGRLAGHVRLELLCGCGRTERPQDVGVPVELAEIRAVRRLLIARRLELVESLDRLFVDGQNRAEVSGSVDGVGGTARDLRDRRRLIHADLRRPGGELIVRQPPGPAAACRHCEPGEDESGGIPRGARLHSGARSITRAEGSPKPKRR